MPRTRRKVALVIETSNAYARDLLHGVRSWVREHGAWAMRLTEHGRGADVPGWLQDWRGDGIIARVENEAIAAALKATKLPVVDVSAALPQPRFPRVITDSRAVTQLAAAHLIERGFKHFGYCGEPRFLWAHQRAGYFKDHLRQAGFECSVFTPANRSNRAGRMEKEVLAIARWLRGLPKPVGILACYDIVGQQVLEACQFAGLAVPDAVAVLGVHNDELLCDLCDPPLTSVIPNARRAGYVAAGLLSEMMNRRRVPVEDHLVEPIGVAARQSTDVVAVRDEKVAAAIRFIREHAQANIVVGDVLRALPMSRTLLERKFKESLGCTPHEHIQNTRMERVKTFLATTTLPIAAIADRMGFEHVEYLSVAFRRATGLSPRDYRTRHRSHQAT